MNELTTLISTIGFPIVSFLISAWFIKYTYDTNLEMEKKHDDEIQKQFMQLSELAQAVNNNSEAIRELAMTINGVKRNE